MNNQHYDEGKDDVRQRYNSCCSPFIHRGSIESLLLFKTILHKVAGILQYLIAFLVIKVVPAFLNHSINMFFQGRFATFNDFVKVSGEESEHIVNKLRVSVDIKDVESPTQDNEGEEAEKDHEAYLETAPVKSVLNIENSIS